MCVFFFLFSFFLIDDEELWSCLIVLNNQMAEFCLVEKVRKSNKHGATSMNS